MPGPQLNRLESFGLAVMTCVAAADLFSYSTPDTFLGPALTAQGASTPQIMVAYGVTGTLTVAAGIVVLLCQSLSAVSGLAPGSKWGVVVAAQSLSLVSSVIMLAWPVTAAVIAARALEGAATAGHTIYCLILLVELSPKSRLAMGIAALTAGMTAGDSIAPVIGAIVYDRAGLRAAFASPAALNALVLLLALLMYPIWRSAPTVARQQLLHRSYSGGSTLLPSHRHQVPISRQPSFPSFSVSSSSFSSLPSFRSVQLENLDISSVVNTLKNPVIFCQCLLLFLEQIVRSALPVVLPATMGTATWLVGVVYIANVVGAVLSPFVVDYTISRYPSVPTQLMSVALNIIMAASCTLAIAFSKYTPIMVVSLFPYGASQSAVETLVYVHVAKQLDILGHHTMTHVSMCMYLLAQCAGGGVGGLMGGVLQKQSWGVQLGVMALGSGVASGFGVILGLKSYMHETKKETRGKQGDSQVVNLQAKDPSTEPEIANNTSRGITEPTTCIVQAQQSTNSSPVPAAGEILSVIKQYSATTNDDCSLTGIMQSAQDLIGQHKLSDSFYLYDLGQLVKLHQTWVSAMPRVVPYYAVKCNPEPALLAVLHALGAGFDCASMGELELVAAVGVHKDKIIFANPCKRPLDLRYARQHSVQCTTFDAVSELEKVAAGCPGINCVLRIRCDDPAAQINLGHKYGAELHEVPELLNRAKALGLQVVGVSFHVGSGCQNAEVYADAIAAARSIFVLGDAAGFRMQLLDIGGGFVAPYDAPSAEAFESIAVVINDALAVHFPPDCRVRVIAEPGRYFAETSATIFATVLGFRMTPDINGNTIREYWLSDSTHGSFRIQVAIDGLEPSFSILRSPLLPEVQPDVGAALLPSRLLGSSGHNDDVICKETLLPELRVGDWILFPNAGAYTVCAASRYAGTLCANPQRFFTCSQFDSLS